MKSNRENFESNKRHSGKKEDFNLRIKKVENIYGNLVLQKSK